MALCDGRSWRWDSADHFYLVLYLCGNDNIIVSMSLPISAGLRSCICFMCTQFLEKQVINMSI